MFVDFSRTNVFILKLWFSNILRVCFASSIPSSFILDASCLDASCFQHATYFSDRNISFCPFQMYSHLVRLFISFTYKSCFRFNKRKFHLIKMNRHSHTDTNTLIHTYTYCLSALILS